MTLEAREKLRLTQEYRVGIRPDGRYCLACGKPLYGPELSHTPPAQPSAVDRIRYRTDGYYDMDARRISKTRPVLGK